MRSLQTRVIVYRKTVQPYSDVESLDDSEGSFLACSENSRVRVIAAAKREEAEAKYKKHQSWRRILLLVLAITIHNFPEGATARYLHSLLLIHLPLCSAGLAVGVGFGGIGKTATATFESARSLAIGIGLQNFPEGLGHHCL